MALGIGVLVATLASGLTKVLTMGFALRALILSLVVLVLPGVLYNLYSLIISETLTYITSYVGGVGLQSAVIQLAGLAAWFGSHLKVPESVAFILSCALGRFVISLIRGI